MSDTLRDRIAEAIWDALDAQRFVGFGPYVDRVNGVIDTEGSDGIDMAAVADAVIEALGLGLEWSVERDYPKFKHYGGGERGIDHCCNECDAATTLDSRELAAHLRDDFNARDSRFRAELLHRFVTEWETTE